MVTTIGASPLLVREALLTAGGYFFDMLSIVNDEYKMKIDENLKSLADQLIQERQNYENEPII